jgi:hypothetical protein
MTSSPSYFYTCSPIKSNLNCVCAASHDSRWNGTLTIQGKKPSSRFVRIIGQLRGGYLPMHACMSIRYDPAIINTTCAWPCTKWIGLVEHDTDLACKISGIGDDQFVVHPENTTVQRVDASGKMAWIIFLYLAEYMIDPLAGHTAQTRKIPKHVCELCDRVGIVVQACAKHILIASFVAGVFAACINGIYGICSTQMLASRTMRSIDRSSQTAMRPWPLAEFSFVFLCVSWSPD